MIRSVRKCYVLFILMIGLSFWALVKNVGLPESPLSDRIINGRPVQHLVVDQLNGLEGEIASQRVQSSLILEKIKENIENSRIRKEAEEQARKVEAHPKAADSKQLVKLDADKFKEGLNENGEDDHGGEDVRNVENESAHGNERGSVIAVLVFVCDRPTVQRCLDSLIKHRPSATQFPIVISQDCGSHPATTDVIESYGDVFTHIKQPDLSEIQVPPKELKLKGYYKIARHYGWALNYTFNELKYENVLIVEDDLEVSPDFFEYFAASLTLLKHDPSLWCVSAWNDNGKAKRINTTASELLHRTDFFPGLGWMLTKDIWRELMVKWPKSYWDDWMREPSQRKGRACIRPEISRTSTFGKNGVSRGTYYQNHLRYIKLNDKFVPFTSMDLSYLMKDQYDVEFVRRVYSSQMVQSVQELEDVIRRGTPPEAEFRLTYRTRESFVVLAKKLNIMDDLRAGVPRTAYRGVVSFIFNDRRVYLAPGANWLGYS